MGQWMDQEHRYRNSSVSDDLHWKQKPAELYKDKKNQILMMFVLEVLQHPRGLAPAGQRSSKGWSQRGRAVGDAVANLNDPARLAELTGR